MVLLLCSITQDSGAERCQVLQEPGLLLAIRPLITLSTGQLSPGNFLPSDKFFGINIETNH